MLKTANVRKPSDFGFGFVSWNLEYSVRVKLTPEAEEILERREQDLGEEGGGFGLWRYKDSEGWSEWQLFHLLDMLATISQPGYGCGHYLDYEILVQE